jgi:putative salt-induced outer membrane protein YdiY
MIRAIVTVLALLVSASAAKAQSAADAASVNAEIRAHEEALAAAIHARDEAAFERLLAPDYILRSAPDVDRRTWIRNALTLCWGNRSTIDGFNVRRHAQVVVATFEITFYQDPASCQAAVLRSVITDIWSREPDGWRLQVRHAAPPPPAEGGVVPQYGVVPLPPAKWDITSELSLVATAGNTETRTVGIGGDATHRTTRGTTRASVAYLSSEADEVLNARSLSLRARQGFQYSRRFQVFGEGLYARDEFAGIEGRTTATAGLAYTAPLVRPHLLTVEIGVGVTDERRVNANDLRFATASAAGHYVWAIVPGSQLTEDAVFTADLQSGSNWRQTSLTAVSVRLSRLLSFKASHSFEYRNAPVEGFGRTDMRTSAALVFSLQRRPPRP